MSASVSPRTFMKAAGATGAAVSTFSCADDHMLKVFRQVAGMPTGEDMGDWYDLTGFSLDTADFYGGLSSSSSLCWERFQCPRAK